VTTPLILLGYGGNVVDILDVIDDLNAAVEANGPGRPRYEVLGFLDHRDELQHRSFHGVPMLGRFADAPRLVDRYPAVRFTTWIGGVDTYQRRPQMIGSVGLPPERFVTLVHPSSSVSRRARVGRGVLIYQHCTVSSSAVIEDHVVVLPHAVISHDCVLGEYAVVTSNVTVGSAAKVGRSCYLGTHCCMLPGVRIGEGSLVGIGGVVLRDVDPYTVVVGNPARRLREASRPDASGP
jgi:sugar O-acyltransferase (sialic acid O-acetyltransferase NeuD family)